jgi:hypothetical protein
VSFRGLEYNSEFDKDVLCCGNLSVKSVLSVVLLMFYVLCFTFYVTSPYSCDSCKEKFVFVKNVLGFVLREIRGFITLMFMNETRMVHKLMSY